MIDAPFMIAMLAAASEPKSRSSTGTGRSLSERMEPIELLRRLESEGDFTSRLALLEELKSLPAGAVWDYYCLSRDVPVGGAWLEEVRRYEQDVLMKR